MKEQFKRTELIFSKENMEKLYNSKVIVFGVGGVGGHLVERTPGHPHELGCLFDSQDFLAGFQHIFEGFNPLLEIGNLLGQVGVLLDGILLRHV